MRIKHLSCVLHPQYVFILIVSHKQYNIPCDSMYANTEDNIQCRRCRLSLTTATFHTTRKCTSIFNTSNMQGEGHQTTHWWEFSQYSPAAWSEDDGQQADCNYCNC